MSLILDALKRAESERGAQAASGLPELSPVSLQQAPTSGRWMILGAVVVVIAAAGVWRYFSSAPSTEVVKVELPPAASTPEPPRPVTSSPVPSGAPATPIAGTEDVANFDEVTGSEESQQLESPIVPAPAIVMPPVPSEIPPAAVSAPPSAVQPQPIARNKAPVPLNETPAAYRAAFPIVTIQVHSYDPSPAARFVRINGYRYVEGESLQAGPKIVEIIANGLVLDWQGERVIYPLN